jgi:hypothetical protein
MKSMNRIENLVSTETLGPNGDGRGTREVLVKGKAATQRTLVVAGTELVVTGNVVRMARPADEWYDDLERPDAIIDRLRENNAGIDIFTFWQRLPDTTPQYAYHTECESIAALPITTFDNWFKKQLNPKTRNLLRKAEKMGVVVKQADFDDAFVDGMVSIFNETAIRQDKPFWHFGKDAQTIKQEFSRYLFREELYGAYHEGALIGFIFLANAGKYAVLGQIISKIEHREKAPNNALIAKAVEVCASKNIPYLVYAMWTAGGLVQFKRNNGFEKFDLPRYYVPITAKGRLALKLNAHHGVAGMLPADLKERLVALRNKWYSSKSRTR